MNTTNKLGRGLNSLLGEKKLNLNNGLMSLDLSADKVQKLSLNLLKPNRFQPRKYFDENELNELSLSIKKFGILQPIIVRKLIEDSSYFEIIAGERRYRAAKIAGFDSVPVIIKEFNDKEVISLAIIENIQRADLSVMEEAEAYHSLINDFAYTQQDVANFIGKSRSHIANLVRLLDLPQEIKEMLYKKELDMGHARALINCNKALEIAKIIVENNLNVRETEKMVKDYDNGNEHILKSNIKKAEISMINKEYFTKIENNLFSKLHLKSKIEFNKEKKKGKIVINYNSMDELEIFLKKINL